MSSPKTQNPAREHHWLPRHYLKGFASKSDAARVWIYERGKSFNPGHQLRRHHPLHTPIKKAAMTNDFYACRQEDGTVDYETYEKKLAVRENSDSLLLAKLRRGEMLTETEKHNFAAYMLLMNRRTPIHRDKFPSTWSKVLSKLRVDSPLLRVFKEQQAKTPPSDLETHAKIAAYIDQHDDVLTQRLAGEIPDDMRLDVMFNDSSLVVDTIAEMNWHILYAPQGSGFIAADNPISFESGIGNASSEVLFPLSTDRVLVAVWDFKETMRFETAERAQVELINRAMMSIAQKNIFYCQDSQLLTGVFNESNNQEAKI